MVNIFAGKKRVGGSKKFLALPLLIRVYQFVRGSSGHVALAESLDDFRYTGSNFSADRIRYADGGEELYDHSNDPSEWTNLANRPEVSSSVAADGLARCSDTSPTTTIIRPATLQA